MNLHFERQTHQCITPLSQTPCPLPSPQAGPHKKGRKSAEGNTEFAYSSGLLANACAVVAFEWIVIARSASDAAIQAVRRWLSDCLQIEHACPENGSSPPKVTVKLRFWEARKRAATAHDAGTAQTVIVQMV